MNNQEFLVSVSNDERESLAELIPFVAEALQDENITEIGEVNIEEGFGFASETIALTILVGLATNGTYDVLKTLVLGGVAKYKKAHPNTPIKESDVEITKLERKQ